MSYDVLVDHLRSAAVRYRSVADELGTEGVGLTNVDPDSIGHVELAAWVKAVAEQCDNATVALHDGATGLADSLDSSAHDYESTDEQVATVFQSPLFGPVVDPAVPFTFGSPGFGTPVVGTPAGPR